MTDLPVIAIRFALYADLMVLAGLVAFTLYGLTPEERASDALPLRKPACALALIGLVLSGIGMMALIAAMAGTSITPPGVSISPASRDASAASAANPSVQSHSTNDPAL